MGKSVPRNIKSRGEILIEEFPEQVSKLFDDNKNLIKELGLKKIMGTKVTNIMAGFITRKMKVKGLPPRPRKIKKEDRRGGRDGDRRGGRSSGGSRGGSRRREDR